MDCQCHTGGYLSPSHERLGTPDINLATHQSLQVVVTVEWDRHCNISNSESLLVTQLGLGGLPAIATVFTNFDFSRCGTGPGTLWPNARPGEAMTWVSFCYFARRSTVARTNSKAIDSENIEFPSPTLGLSQSKMLSYGSNERMHWHLLTTLLLWISGYWLVEWNAERQLFFLGSTS